MSSAKEKQKLRQGSSSSSSSSSSMAFLPELPSPASNGKEDTKNNRSKSNSPSSPSSSSSSSSANPPSFPKPSELIDRYVALGMEKEQASEKVIEELQAALHRSLYPMQRLMSLEKSFRTTAAQMDVAAHRIHLIEAKLDSKPEIPQVFLSGVAAGAFLKTAASATPAVLSAVTRIYGDISKSFHKS